MADDFLKVTVTTLRHDEQTNVVTVTFDRPPTPPVAPAFLFQPSRTGEPPNRRALMILEWCRQAGPCWEFEAAKSPSEIRVGDTYGYQGIWTEEGYEAVANLRAIWVKTRYPDDGSHAHCLLTFATISSYAGDSVGYLNDQHGWLSEDAYRAHIIDDVYGIRRRIASGQLPAKSE